MKIIGIVGSNAEFSHNRLLLQFIEKKFSDLFEFEILEIKDIPMFNQDEDQSKSFPVQYMYNKLIRADGVIIATPEHNYSCVEEHIRMDVIQLTPIRKQTCNDYGSFSL